MKISALSLILLTLVLKTSLAYSSDKLSYDCYEISSGEVMSLEVGKNILENVHLSYIDGKELVTLGFNEGESNLSFQVYESINKKQLDGNFYVLVANMKDLNSQDFDLPSLKLYSKDQDTGYLSVIREFDCK